MRIVKAATPAALLAGAAAPALADQAGRLLNRLILSRTGCVHDGDDDDGRRRNRGLRGADDDD